MLEEKERKGKGPQKIIKNKKILVVKTYTVFRPREKKNKIKKNNSKITKNVNKIKKKLTL